MTDAQKIIAQAVLLPFDFDPTKPPRSLSAAEAAEELRQNTLRRRERVSDVAQDGPKQLSAVALTDGHRAQLVRALSRPHNAAERRKRFTEQYVLRPDTPLPPASTINPTNCTPATAAVLRTLAVLDEYDHPTISPEPSSVSRRVSMPTDPSSVGRRVSMPTEPRSAGPRVSISTDSRSAGPRISAPTRPASPRVFSPNDWIKPRPALKRQYSAPNGPGNITAEPESYTPVDTGSRQTFHPTLEARRMSMGDVRSRQPDYHDEGFRRPQTAFRSATWAAPPKPRRVSSPVPAPMSGSMVDSSRDPRQRRPGG
ncbi:hypothetical protein ANO11243_041390 [Dothideomycetidae sp. 11243]|nr:hypothetical protein ANO11243_041390 [fungal sp. No.11243]